jgi:hypothetical protein
MTNLETCFIYLLRTASTSVDHVSRKLLVDQALCSAIFC